MIRQFEKYHNTETEIMRINTETLEVTSAVRFRGCDEGGEKFLAKLDPERDSLEEAVDRIITMGFEEV